MILYILQSKAKSLKKWAASRIEYIQEFFVAFFTMSVVFTDNQVIIVNQHKIGQNFYLF